MKYKIKTIPEFLELIEKEKLRNYIYRGQNEIFHGIKASGFRPYNGSFNSDKFYNIDKIVNDFKNSIIADISEEEKMHFIAYSQHHGVPTNLVDFSRSPLIALFFACLGKSEPVFSIGELVNSDTYDVLTKLKYDSSLQNTLINNLITKLEKPYYSQHAQMYLIAKERLIDATKILINYDSSNIFELLIEHDEVKYWLHKELSEKFKDYSLSINWIKNMINLYGDNKINNYDNYQEIDINYENKLDQFVDDKPFEQLQIQVEDLYSYILENLLDISIANNKFFYSDGFSMYKENELCSKVYIALLLNIIKIAKYSFDDIKLKFDFYFSYSPPQIFDRIKSQKGIFIVQSYTYEIDTLYNYGVLIYQEIIPDYHIEIENATSILSELNYLGINNETVFNDHDNIARTIKYNHDKLF